MEQEIQSNDSSQSDSATPDVGSDSSATKDINPGASDVSNTTQTPTPNSGDVNKGQNQQPSPDIFEKRFKDMESKFTRTRQQQLAEQKEKSRLESQLAELSKAVQTLTKKPYSPADFIKDLQEKGPEAIFPLVEEKLKLAQEKASQDQKAYADRIELLETKNALSNLRADSENYPDFRKLEDTMKEIWESEECPHDIQDPKLGPDQVLVKLYELAKAKHSQDAVKAAHEDGLKSGQKQLAKEASTSVATGGKAGGTAIPDTKNMDTKTLRALIQSMGGVVDRD